jgi:hypothetical protein
MNNWTEDNENLLKDIGQECEILYLAHSTSYLKYNKLGNYFSIPSILISAIVGSLSFNQSFNSNETNQFILGGLNLLVSGLGSIYKILQYQSLETEHFYLSKMWSLLYENIRIELAKAPHERRNYLEFVKEVENTRLQLLEKNSIIPKDIIQKYKKKYNNKFDLPISLHHLSPIKIYNRSYIPTPLTPSITSSMEVNV